MTIGEYVSDRIAKLCGAALGLGATCIFLKLTGTGDGVIALLALAWIIALALWNIVKWRRLDSRLNTLESIMDNLDKKYLFSECAPKPSGALEKKLLSLMRRSGKSMIEEVSAARATERDYREYLESWVHEIKAPITTMKLQCANSKSELSGKILPQLSEVEEHVERVLYYARAGSVEKDFVIKKTNLGEIAASTLRRLQPLLIQSGMAVETGDLDFQVYTDGKWVEFMLGQLLLNAARYKSEKPVVKIGASQMGKLVVMEIEDNGIGISEQDLPRVFHRGFTGTNGRQRGGSTGMGLHICKMLSEPLHIQLLADSRENEYTRISLVFGGELRQNTNLTKM